jgi:hypothetical protein
LDGCCVVDILIQVTMVFSLSRLSGSAFMKKLRDNTLNLMPGATGLPSRNARIELHVHVQEFIYKLFNQTNSSLTVPKIYQDSVSEMRG